jgi:uncharacterized protein YjdB
MKAGTATITVTADGGKTAACVVTVSPSSYPVTGLSLNKLSTGILVGATETLIATVAPDNATNKNVNWNSSAPTIATVSSSGVVSGVAEGTAIITATTVDQNKTATCIVTISARALAVTSVSLNKSNTGLLIGGTETLIATVLPLTATNQNVTWKSSDDTIATVANGIVSGVAAGTAIITATTNDQNKTATCTVRVSATTVSVTSVYIRTSTSLAAGNYETLACTINPNTATNQNVTWTSSAPAIATVSETGVVSGVSPGSATITVSTEDGGKTAFCNVTITAVPVTGVTLDNSTLALNVGATGTIAATVLPANATNKAVIWSSSDTTKATVSASGVVTAVAAGSATITVRTADGSRQATCTVTITAIPSLTVDILGNPYVGEVLFANAKSNVAGVIYYEWFRGLDKISSNTSNNYTIRFEDAGKTITVKVTCGTQTVEKSVSVADVDYTVEIANSDNNLFATIRYGYNTYYSINTLGFTCQWYRDDVAISGSTLDHYTPQPADAGKAIKVRVIRYEKTVFSEPFNIPNGSNVTSETLGLYLTILSENTASSPHNITLKVNDNNYNDFDDIKNALNSAYNKYVNLNLSGSTITNFGSLYGCTSLVSITIPASVLEFSESAFDSCNSLTDILVESGNTKYSSDNGILYNIDKTTLIVCPQNKTDPITIPSSVTIIGSFAFEDCILTSITIPNNVKEIEDNAFTRCTKLASVTITDGVTSIGESAFSDCTSLTSVIIPDSVTSIKSNTFSGCTSLANVTIGSGVTSIDTSAFSGCTSLTSITVNSSNPNYASEGGILYNKAKTAIIHIPKKISGNVTIPNGVTSIGRSAFVGCTGLTGITIPGSVTSIGMGAFTLCTSLTSVTFGAGGNIYTNDFGDVAFPEGASGDGGNRLKNAYLAATPRPGTLMRAANGSTWTKQ